MSIQELQREIFRNINLLFTEANKERVQNLQNESLEIINELKARGSINNVIIDYDNAKTILDYVIHFGSVRNQQEDSGLIRLNNQVLKKLEAAIKSVGGKSEVEKERSVRKLAKRTAILLSPIPAIMIEIGNMIAWKYASGFMIKEGKIGIGIRIGTAIAIYNASIIEFKDEIRFARGIITRMVERLNSVATTMNHTATTEIRSEDTLEIIPESVATRVIRRLGIIAKAFIHAVKVRPVDTFGTMVGVLSAVNFQLVNRAHPIPLTTALAIVSGMGARSTAIIGIRAGLYVTNQSMNAFENKATSVIRTLIYGTEVSSLRSLLSTDLTVQVNVNQIEA